MPAKKERSAHDPFDRPPPQWRFAARLRPVWPGADFVWAVPGAAGVYFVRAAHHYHHGGRADHRLHRRGGDRGGLCQRGDGDAHQRGHPLAAGRYAQRGHHGYHRPDVRLCPVRQEHRQHLAHSGGHGPVRPGAGGRAVPPRERGAAHHRAVPCGELSGGAVPPLAGGGGGAAHRLCDAPCGGARPPGPERHEPVQPGLLLRVGGDDDGARLQGVRAGARRGPLLVRRQ